MDDSYRSSQFKRGIVRENDPKTGRSKVEMVDEDGTQSFWLAWNMPAAGGSKIFNQPDIGSQVNCLVDRHGDDGVILGARYSKEDKPPTENGKLLKMLLEGGLDFEYDKAAGTLTLKLSALTIEAPAITFKGASLKHNAKNIGDSHKHGGIQVGASDTDVPSN